ICILGGVVFGLLDLSNWRPDMLLSFLGKLVGMSLAAIAMGALGQRWVVRRTWGIAVFIVSVCYVVTGVDRILLPNREYHTTARLLWGAAVTTSVIIPWGVGGQLVTVAVGALCMLAAVLAHDGTLRAMASDPAAAVAVAFLFPLGAAREVELHRRGHRRELLERQRAETRLRRLTQHLEHLVAERTLALEQAHEALRQHQAELAHMLRLHTMGEMAAALAHEINQPLCATAPSAGGGVPRAGAVVLDPAVLRVAFEAVVREGRRMSQILCRVRNV